MSKVENKMFPFNLRRPTLEVLWAKSWRSWEDWSQLIHFLCWFWTLVGTPNKNNTWFSQQPICRPFFITKTSPKRKPITGWGLPTRHEKKQDSKLANKKSTESTWFYLEESFNFEIFSSDFFGFSQRIGFAGSADWVICHVEVLTAAGASWPGVFHHFHRDFHPRFSSLQGFGFSSKQLLLCVSWRWDLGVKHVDGRCNLTNSAGICQPHPNVLPYFNLLQIFF